MKFKYKTITISKKVELDKIKIQSQKHSIINNMNIKSDGVSKKYENIDPDDIILEAEDEYEQKLLDEILTENETTDVRIIIQDTDPRLDSNVRPITNTQEFVWINKLSGEIFTCTDYTYDKNVWVGQLRNTAIVPQGYTLDGILNDGLICYFDCNKINGNKILSNNDLYAISKNVTNSKISVNNKSLYFKGNGYAKITNDELFRTQDLTITYWVRPRTSWWNQNHIWKDALNEFSIYQDTDRCIHFQFGENFNYKHYTTDQSISLNEWTHISIIRKDCDCTILINNIEVSYTLELNGDDIQTVGWSWNPVHIGIGDKGSFKGYIDDVYIFNRALDVLEIDKIYNKYN